MAKAVVVDGTGVVALSLEEQEAAQREQMRGVWGEDLTASPQTPPNQIAGIQALGLSEVSEAIVEDGNANSVDHSEGTQLEVLGSNLDVKRRDATRSLVTATLTGVAGTGVPAGSRAQTMAGAVFVTIDAVVLSPSGVDVDMQAVEEGPVEAAVGTLTQIVTVINGWETVTNASAAVIGRDRQTDDEYRGEYLTRTAHSSVGPLPALDAALVEALAGKRKVVENTTAAEIVTQEFSVGAHAILVITETGSDGDVQRAVENHRGMGVGTITALRGGAEDNSTLMTVTDGDIVVDGTTYDTIDLSAATDGAELAAALTTAIDGSGVVVRYIRTQYVAFYRWRPDYESPVIEDGTAGTLATDFALREADVTEPPGPFLRPVEQDLTITAAVTRRGAFPGDGLARMRAALRLRVGGYATLTDAEKLLVGIEAAQESGYQIGEQIWSNDLLCEIEAVRGTRVTSFTVQHDSTDVSGVDQPLDTLWTLATGDITITIT